MNFINFTHNWVVTVISFCVTPVHYELSQAARLLLNVEVALETDEVTQATIQSHPVSTKHNTKRNLFHNWEKYEARVETLPSALL